MANIINIPDKTVSSELTADEFNTIKNAINEAYNEATEVTHDLYPNHFIEAGTSTINGKPVPVIHINLASIINTDQLEIVNGKISIKQSFLDSLI